MAMVHAVVIQHVAAAESDLQFNPAFLSGENENIADLSWVNA